MRSGESLRGASAAAIRGSRCSSAARRAARGRRRAALSRPRRAGAHVVPARSRRPHAGGAGAGRGPAPLRSASTGCTWSASAQPTRAPSPWRAHLSATGEWCAAVRVVAVEAQVVAKQLLASAIPGAMRSPAVAVTRAVSLPRGPTAPSVRGVKRSPCEGARAVVSHPAQAFGCGLPGCSRRRETQAGGALGPRVDAVSGG